MSIEALHPRDLRAVASSYVYDPGEMKGFERHLWQRMERYGGGYGHAMTEHLSRTSNNLLHLLRDMEYSDQVAANLAHANLFHDLGKTRQAPSLYNLPEKPTEDIKRERVTGHTTLITDILEEALDFFPHLKGHPHVGVMNCIGRYHHERINGKGPKGLSGDELDEPLEIIGIVDTVDGKSLPRLADAPLPAGEAVKRQMARMAEALREMTGLPAYTDKPEKHAGEFRGPLLMRAIDFYQKDMDVWILPRPDSPGRKSGHPVLAL